MATTIYAVVELPAHVPRSRNLSDIAILPSIRERRSPRKKNKKSPQHGYGNVPSGWPEVRIVHMYPQLGRSDNWIRHRRDRRELFTVQESTDEREDDYGVDVDSIPVLGGGRRVSFGREIEVRWELLPFGHIYLSKVVSQWCLFYLWSIYLWFWSKCQ